MSAETVAEQGALKEPFVATPFPQSWWGRLAYGIYLIVLPATAFSSTGLFKPAWQSGTFSAYLALFLLPEASLVFFLLMAYSVISYLSLLLSPNRSSGSSLVRFGVYTGTFLALQYSILAGLYFIKVTFAPAFILAWIIPIVFAILYRWAIIKWTARRVNRVLLLFSLGSLLIASLITEGSALLLVLIGFTMAAPFWSFLMGLRASIWLFKNYETKLTVSRGLGLTAWLAMYVAAWRFDILKMYELYTQLPTNPSPDCYIATAAAHGHPKFVRSWTVPRLDGRSLQANQQLQRLKCAELALLAVNPQLHGILRHVYDRLGKALAQYIQYPLLADVAYLLLKPWEWMANFVLKMIIPELDSVSKKMYVIGS